MGFGILFLGYLVTYVLSLLLNAIGFGFMGYLLGVLLMAVGVYRLYQYEKAFRYPMIPLGLMTVPIVLRAVTEVSAWLSVQTANTDSLFFWLRFLLSVLFQTGLLYAVTQIAKTTGLNKIRASACRNGIFVGIYTVVCFLAQVLPEQEAVYFRLPTVVLETVLIFCNLILILTCAKDICPAGEEEILPKDSKIAFLNTVRNAMDTNREKAYGKLRRESEDRLAKRNQRKK